MKKKHRSNLADRWERQQMKADCYESNVDLHCIYLWLCR